MPMEFAICFDTNWNDLPNEIKVLIVSNLGNNCRLSLRACSRQDQKLVDSVQFRKLHFMSIKNEENNFEFNIIRVVFGGVSRMTFTSFDEFQEKLLKELENVDYIRTLSVLQTNTKQSVMLSKNGNMKKVRRLIFPDRTLNLASVLKQVEPFHLKKLNTYSDDVDPAVFSMPQVVNAESINGENNSLCDEQLLALNCSELYLETVNDVTSAGFNKYIQKCLSTLDKKPVLFSLRNDVNTTRPSDIFKGFGLANSLKLLLKEFGKLILNSSSPNFKLEIEYQSGTFSGQTIQTKRIDKRDRSFKAIKKLEIYNNVTCCELKIKEKRKSLVSLKFNTPEQLQAKLTEELDEIDYIREIVLLNTSHTWNLRNSENRNIAAGKLFIQGDDSYAILKQFEPVHLKEVIISGETDDERIYDLPQVIHAQKLYISNCLIRDDQLLRLDVITLDLKCDTTGNSYLTESGINALVKKCLLTVDNSDFYLYIYSLAIRRDSFQLFEGLDISSQDRFPDGSVQVVVNSPFPNFQLKLTQGCNILQSSMSADSFTIERIEKIRNRD